ncbi:hypothetical protein [Algoriphagus boritolerans]|uniref:hypothetical protein n=1 Tax=Algoriphagus boritolerans TaxID=308111 RepID=UPI000A8CEEFD
MIQPALKVGKPNDKYEHEAESVADKVMMMPSTSTTSLMSASPGGLQMKTSEEEEVQMFPLSAGISMIHRSQEEEEIQMSSDEEEVQLFADHKSLVRLAEEEEEVKLKGEEEETIQRSGGEGGTVSPQLSTQIQQSVGSGAPCLRQFSRTWAIRSGRISQKSECIPVRRLHP